MGYTLAGTTIKRPQSITVENSTQVTQIRTLSGTVNRDFFGSNKRVWKLSYSTITKADFDIIDAIYQAYLTAGTAIAFVSTEANYLIPSTNVHVDLLSRDFSYKGGGYLSDFQLILTEA